MKSFSASIKSMRRSVKIAEHALRRGNEIEVLAAKKQIIKNLTDTKSGAPEGKPQGVISYRLETDSPLNKEIVQKMAQIRTLRVHPRRRKRTQMTSSDDDSGDSGDNDSDSSSDYILTDSTLHNLV